MSDITVVNQTNNQAHFDYSTAKVFVGNNRVNKGLFDEPNGSGEFTLPLGQVVGRIAATGKYKICVSTATDGSQIPVGIVYDSVTMAQSATGETIHVAIKGDVVEDKILFSGAETLATVVTITDDNAVSGGDTTTNTRIMRDLIQSLGFVIVPSTDLTGYDNQ